MKTKSENMLEELPLPTHLSSLRESGWASAGCELSVSERRLSILKLLWNNSPLMFKKTLRNVDSLLLFCSLPWEGNWQVAISAYLWNPLDSVSCVSYHTHANGLCWFLESTPCRFTKADAESMEGLICLPHLCAVSCQDTTRRGLGAVRASLVNHCTQECHCRYL